LTPITDTLRKDQCTITVITRTALIRMRNAFDKMWEKSKHTFYVQYIFLKIVRLWDNVEKYARQDKDDMAHAHWMLENWGYSVIPIAFPYQSLRERAPMLRLYVHCLSYGQCFHREVNGIITQNRISPSCHILSGMTWSCSTFSIIATHSSSDILRAFQFCDGRFQQRQSLILCTMSLYTKILNYFPR